MRIGHKTVNQYRGVILALRYSRMERPTAHKKEEEYGTDFKSECQADRSVFAVERKDGREEG